MGRLGEELAAIVGHVDDILRSVRALEERLRLAGQAWPDHQVARCDGWHGRDEPAPPGVLWASDGLAVWIIRHDGGPIPAEATLVHYWTAAWIPAPPGATGGRIDV